MVQAQRTYTNHTSTVSKVERMCLQAGVFVKGVGSQREPPHKNVGTEKRPGGGGGGGGK